MSTTDVPTGGPLTGASGASGPGRGGGSERPVWWSNWAGNQRCRVPVLRPTTEAELCRIVALAAEQGRAVKAVGAGHSFTDIALTDGVLLDLSAYGRVLSVDRDACRVTVQAGIRLRELSAALWARGLALENLGDIDVQSVAGATATATHGTGLGFRNLSSAIVGLRIVDGRGEVVECSADRHPEVFAAARAGIGALGVLSTVTLRVVPAFHLHAVEEPRRVDEVLEAFDDLVRDHDHFEFFWVPGTGWALTKTNRRNHEPPAPRSRWDEFVQDRWGPNLAFGLVNRLGTLRPSALPRLSRLLPSSGRVEYNDRSYRVFASPRDVRFVEMEYSVPLAATVEAVQRVRRIVGELGHPVSFPVEVRAVRGDDITLSTASGRDSGYVAVHMYRDMPHEPYFRRVEAALSELDGRPHWGKLHHRTAADLAPVYPGWDGFLALRDRMDPDRTFRNAYLTRVLGP
ncbi:MAG: D-arabinono-1,4-lactone oxidase [Microthrixaceae bacterium]